MNIHCELLFSIELKINPLDNTKTKQRKRRQTPSFEMRFGCVCVCLCVLYMSMHDIYLAIKTAAKQQQWHIFRIIYVICTPSLSFRWVVIIGVNESNGRQLEPVMAFSRFSAIAYRAHTLTHSHSHNSISINRQYGLRIVSYITFHICVYFKCSVNERNIHKLKHPLERDKQMDSVCTLGIVIRCFRFCAMPLLRHTRGLYTGACVALFGSVLFCFVYSYTLARVCTKYMYVRQSIQLDECVLWNLWRNVCVAWLLYSFFPRVCRRSCASFKWLTAI